MKIIIVLPNGTRQPIEVSEQVTLRRLLPALAAKIVLPRRDEAGTAVAYYATHHNNPIPDDQPLTTLNLPPDAELVLHPVTVPDPHEVIELEPEPEPEHPHLQPNLPRPAPIPRRRERQRPFSRTRRVLSIGCALMLLLVCCLIIGLFSGLSFLFDRFDSSFNPISAVPVSTATKQIVEYTRETVTIWDFAVVDAEYDPLDNQLVMISSDPPLLHAYNPTIHRDTVIELDGGPTAVALSHSGLYAAVSQENDVSYMNLSSGQPERQQEGIANAAELILQGEDQLYAFVPPNSLTTAVLGQPDLTSITLPSSAPNYVLRLAPDGRSLYGTTRGPEPGRLEKIDITRGTPQFMYDSGDKADTCGEVWLSEDGRFAFTGCGHIWRLADQRQNDMVLLGNFFDTPQKIIALTHSAAAGNILLIPEATDNQILQFSDDGFDLLSTRSFPEGTHGRYIFLNNHGTQYYAIVQTDTGQFGLVFGEL
ncbi:MAG: hypothetical protein H6658_15185 [Ardenticatenaceae bacterium]|nr:hypothetical protein [Ardenticatenaceae bacterium]